jgi:hypothetical protein
MLINKRETSMAEFTCYLCNNTYPKQNDDEWNDIKAAEEMLTLYPETKNDPTEVICDPCNDLFLAWFATLTDEEKRAMRENN